MSKRYVFSIVFIFSHISHYEFSTSIQKSDISSIRVWWGKNQDFM